jgi:molybdopterin-biosynthesis enzyme MoeA-like protein
VQEIVAAVRAMSARYDHVFTSGGVGPTHDDVTLPSVARAFDMKIARRPELEHLIRTAMAHAFHERDLRMADVPDGARLVYGNPAEPGRWPVIAVRNVYVLPGVPAIFRRKFESMREQFRSGPIHSRAVYSREDEGSIAAALDAVVAEFPLVTVGSYPHFDVADHKVQITLDGRDREMVERATAQVVERLGPAFVRQE